jgi:hypothetical protein
MSERQTASVHALPAPQDSVARASEIPPSNPPPKRTNWLTETLDWLVKLLPIFATVGVVYIAEGFKVASTASTLLSEREKSDSQLRTAMFAKLVDPLTDGHSSEAVPLERERLLAELLALNFHEHIELKPLLLHVDRQLAQAAEKGGEEAQRALDSRLSLHAVARQVGARQTAQLTRANGTESLREGSHLLRFDIGAVPLTKQAQEKLAPKAVKFHELNDLIEIVDPSGKYTLWLTVEQADWDNETLLARVSITGVEDQQEHAHHTFALSWFDFPLTDNTLLADGTRFALILDQIYDANERLDKSLINTLQSGPLRRARVNVLWFPPDYISVRERPTNHREFRRSLGINK